MPTDTGAPAEVVLKACPFCDGPAAVEIDDAEWDAARVICRECGATGPWEDLGDHPSQAAASAAVSRRWNTRAQPLAADALDAGTLQALHLARIWFELALGDGDAGTDFLNEGDGWSSAVQVLEDIRTALSSGKTVGAGEGFKR